MNGFGIYVKNTLLEKKHWAAMGEAVWLYIWLLDKMTSISEDGVGKVLGGKPIQYSDFEDNLGLSRRTYVKYMEILRDAGYITTMRTRYGLVIEVHKAKKVFHNQQGSRDAQQAAHLKSEMRANRNPDAQQAAHLYRQYKTEQKEINKESSAQTVDKPDHRGKPAPHKEKIREMLEAKKLSTLLEGKK